MPEHGAGHAPAHVEVPKHAEPSKHADPVRDPSRKGRLSTIAGELHTHAKTSEERVLKSSGVDAFRRGGDPIMEQARRLREKTADFSTGLYGYWSYAKERLSDSYTYRQGGELTEVQELLRGLDKTDKKLDKQLQAWAEATSPYKEYDVDRIEEVGKELADTLKEASDYLNDKLPKENLGDPKVKRDMTFHTSMLLAVSGLAEHIADRAGDLAAGKTVPDVTMSNATIELISRSAQDDSRLKLETQLDTSHDIGDALEDLTSDAVSDNLEKHYAFQAEMNMLKKDDPLYTEKLRGLQEKLEGLGLGPFFDVMEAAKGGKDKDIGSALQELTGFRNRLSRLKGWERDPQLAQQRDDVLKQRKALVESVLPKMRDFMENNIREQENQLGKYKVTMRDKLAGFEKQPQGKEGDFWTAPKESVLGKLDKLNRKDLRDVLTDAFSKGGFSKKIGDFAKTMRDPGAKAEKMQSQASELMQTADSYMGRVEDIFKGMDSHPQLGPLKAELLASIGAIKESTVKELSFQFKLGRFD
jgi:hypothetical protein